MADRPVRLMSRTWTTFRRETLGGEGQFRTVVLDPCSEAASMHLKNRESDESYVSALLFFSVEME